jgi:two-component system, NtrC family, response regulator HydG
MNENRLRSVLVVDDEVDASENLRDILSDLGYHVDTARNGPEAIERVRNRAYDVALLDLKMPGMDGVSTYRQIKRLRPETVAIVVSAFSGSDLAESAVQEGAAQVVGKPVEVPELLAAIEATLAQPLVLVVDDDTDFCQNLWDILCRRGYRLALAHNAEQARQQLAMNSFDIVLIDLRLSHSNGGETVFRIVRETNPQARRILVTGFREDMLETIHRLISQGVDAVCYKPVDIDNLIGTLRGGLSESPPSFLSEKH